MTIAAGFVHQDGVLLCADTQQETWALKFYSSKVGYFDMRQTERMELPSTRAARIWARSSMLKRFML